MSKNKRYNDIIVIKEEDIPKIRKHMPPPVKRHKNKNKYDRKKDKKIKFEEITKW